MRRSLALLAVLLLAPPATAAAKPVTRSGIYGERYCELFELRGASVDDLSATVWNTIGLNRCPASWWTALDTDALKTRLGAFAIVRNGPRRWVIDSATGYKLGPVRGFAGQRMRAVATLTFAGAGDLVRKPYEQRVVLRSNDWRWAKGRRVYELSAPGGRLYRMQAMAMIVDPGLGLADLAGLGSRLSLPAGWTFRSRVLPRAVVLRTRGRATILQDELQNTYQRIR